MTWLLGILVAIDQLANAILGGSPDETISSRVGRAADRGDHLGIAIEALIDLPFALAGQRNHCARVIERPVIERNDI